MMNSQYVRGERPTCAGPHPVQKFLAALRRATGRGARTRFALRRGNSKWSAKSEPLRCRKVAGSWRSRPKSAASVGASRLQTTSFLGEMHTDRLAERCTCLPGSGGKIAARW